MFLQSYSGHQPALRAFQVTLAVAPDGVVQEETTRRNRICAAVDGTIHAANIVLRSRARRVQRWQAWLPGNYAFGLGEENGLKQALQKLIKSTPKYQAEQAR